MKLFKAYIFVQLMLPLLYVVANEINNNARVVQNLANALVSEQFSVGVFENTPLNERDPDWYKLQDGTSLWEQEFHLPPGSGWRTMRLQQALKGEIDNLIFFKAFPALGRKGLFSPTSGSRWILILHPAFKNGQLRASTEYYTPDDIQKYPILKSDTLFEIYDYVRGTFCIHWPTNASIPLKEPLYSTNLVNRIQAILDAADFPPDYTTLYQQVESALQDTLIVEDPE